MNGSLAAHGWILLAVGVCAAVPSAADAASQRFALVMGNADYAATSSMDRLPDVTASAVHMADTVAALGFEVHEHRALINLSRAEMLDAVTAFAHDAREAEVVFVYYAGHGFQQGQRNQLIPIDARQDSGNELRPTVDVEDELLAPFRDSRAILVFVIDACRETGARRAAMVRPSDRVKNRIIAFPVRAGSFAPTPSRYTPALIDALKQPGLRIEDVFNKARQKVVHDSDGFEQPEEFGALPDMPLYLQPSVVPEGTLATIDRNTYYLVTDGRWRRIPDIGSIERLGFDISLAALKEEEDRIRSPRGRDYPTVNSNMLQSRTCLYYLFWGMKWCVPSSENAVQVRPYGKGARRSLTADESVGIPTGDVKRLPSGLALRFGDAPQLYEINSGVLTKATTSGGRQVRPISLPPFMRGRLGASARVNTNQLANSQVIADDARQRLYIIESAGSRVLLADMKSGKAVVISDLTPSFLALAPKSGHLFVADSATHVIHELDVTSGRGIRTLPQVFPTPTPFTGMVVTPDEKRLYVGNQGGGGVLEAGNIVAYDLSNPTLTVSIGGVACPEHMSITADGEHVYLASQCGGGKDALFVIDTNLDVATGVAPDLAVGRAAAVMPGGSKIYASRGEPERITVVDAFTGENLGSVPVDARSMAVAPDGSAVAVLSSTDPKTLYLIDTATDRVTTVRFAQKLEAVTIGESNGNTMVIAWIPERPQPIYFQSVAGLVAGQQ